MKRTQSFAVMLTLLVAAQAPAVLIDNFDSLSPEWQFIPGETGAQLIYEVAGGEFRASGFTNPNAGTGHTVGMVRRIFSDPTSGEQNLTLRARFTPPATENLDSVRFALQGIDSTGTYISDRRVRFEKSASGYAVTLSNGNQSNSLFGVELSGYNQVEIVNAGATCSLFLNGQFLTSATNSSASQLNPMYGGIRVQYEGGAGVSSPMSIDYIQVVPEPSTFAGLGLATWIVMKRALAGGRGEEIRRRRKVWHG